MSTFFESAAAYIASTPEHTRRQQLWTAFEALGLPTTSDEVWRYAPLSQFALDDFSVVATAPATTDDVDLAALTAGALAVIVVRDGHLERSPSPIDGVVVSVLAPGTPAGAKEYEERYGADAFALMSAALTPATIEIRVAAGSHVSGTIVIAHRISGPSAFPSTRIILERGSSVNVVECWFGGAGALVVPVSEYEIGENAQLRLSTYQRLDDTAWHIARTTALLARDARMHQAVVGLGGHYDRARNDAIFLGTGASNELHTTFLGSGTQVHDLRTHQLHEVGRTNSTLLSKGAVADHARCVYTGLIEIEKGARRTDARQTNLNLLLAPTAHADTVPNLDIRENDVVCAHASSVGPLDELQRWYLESRGVDRDSAERLLVQGFFREMTDSMPANIAAAVDADVARVLASTRVVPA